MKKRPVIKAIVKNTIEKAYFVYFTDNTYTRLDGNIHKVKEAEIRTLISTDPLFWDLLR